jgi:acyl-CoA synthetase (NDP forming)
MALYVEGTDTPKNLLAAAKRHAGKKPIVAYKTGSGAVGDAAARSHTGSTGGSARDLHPCLQTGGYPVLAATRSLLDTAKALASCPVLSGPGVAVLSGQAGPSMAACDVCEQEGLEIVRFSEKPKTASTNCFRPWPFAPTRWTWVPPGTIQAPSRELFRRSWMMKGFTAFCF